MIVRTIIAVVAALAAGGCTSDAPAPAAGLDGASTASSVSTVEFDGTSEVALLTTVSAVAYEGKDTVVFTFRNRAPAYAVRYLAKPVRADGSGDPVDVDGAAVLVVRMEPALDADLSQESAPQTYVGPRRISPDTTAVAELVRIGGFEAVLTWAIGLDEQRPFRVARLHDPARLVIEIATAE